MKHHILIFSVFMLFAPTFVYGACSKQNLTRCLDSACAINIGSNPAARCQYCGSSSAGEPTKSTAMKSVSAGASAKYNISDKELKKAPKDPGERYVWATRLCLEKLKDCTTDDVTDNYDSLIEQSCKAAGISAEFANLSKKLTKTKSQSSCSEEINACIVNDKHCNSDYKKCESDSDFDKYFSQCSIESQGCETFLSDIRKSLISTRDSMFANANKLLQSIVASYQKAREQKLAAAQNSCKNNAAKNDCVKRVCANNMKNKCASGHEVEKSMAENLCLFYDTACARLK